jgi:hypothetical protein
MEGRSMVIGESPEKLTKSNVPSNQFGKGLSAVVGCTKLVR